MAFYLKPCKVVQENGLWWALYKRKELWFRFPFRRACQAVTFCRERGFRSDWGQAQWFD